MARFKASPFLILIGNHLSLDYANILALFPNPQALNFSNVEVSASSKSMTQEWEFKLSP